MVFQGIWYVFQTEGILLGILFDQISQQSLLEPQSVSGTNSLELEWFVPKTGLQY